MNFAKLAWPAAERVRPGVKTQPRRARPIPTGHAGQVWADYFLPVKFTNKNYPNRNPVKKVIDVRGKNFNLQNQSRFARHCAMKKIILIEVVFRRVEARSGTRPRLYSRGRDTR